MSEFQFILVDDPRPRVRRITLNRPEKRNALSNPLRGEVFRALEAADRDESVHVTIIRGAGPCFSAGYDLGGNNAKDQPYFTGAATVSGRATSWTALSRFGIWPSP